MFCPAVGVIQCCDAERATGAQEREFSLHPDQASSSHSSVHPLSPAFCLFNLFPSPAYIVLISEEYL